MNEVGSVTGAELRSAILKERDELVRAGQEDQPRDSELSAGKYDDDLDKVKKARLRVQTRLLQGNAADSSDEEYDERNDRADGAGKKNATVLHFKRNFKSGAAAQTRRRRAGRFGRRAGHSDDDDDYSDDVTDGSDSDSDGGMGDDEVHEDEFYRYDHNNLRVNGRYDTEGFFIVDIGDRDVPGRCDKAGYMLDEYGNRIQDFDKARLMARRAYMLPQADEFYRNDAFGVQVSGQFDKDGYFYVDPKERNARGRCDKAGFLIDKHGKRLVDYQMKERIRKRSYASAQPDEFYRIDADGNKVKGHYTDDGYFIVVVEDRNVPGRCDRDGFMLDSRKVRIMDDVIRDRRRVRGELYPREDEFYALDSFGGKVGGRYDRRGYFIVDPARRREL